MKIKAKYSIVVNGTGRITKETKIFRNKQDAQEYAASLEDKFETIDLETILD